MDRLRILSCSECGAHFAVVRAAHRPPGQCGEECRGAHRRRVRHAHYLQEKAQALRLARIHRAELTAKREAKNG